jgi:hypothetical protein
MVAGQRQCPKLTFIGLGKHELFCSCSLLGFRSDESIWRPYPAVASSWSLFFERMIIDGRMASSGIDVPFQLIHYTVFILHSMFFLLPFLLQQQQQPQVTLRSYADHVSPIKPSAATYYSLCKHDVTADLSPSDKRL